MLAFNKVNVSRLVSVRVRRAGVMKVLNCLASRGNSDDGGIRSWRSEVRGVWLAEGALLVSSSRNQTIDGA